MSVLITAELPGVYLDPIILDADTTRLRLINRSPEPDELDVPLATDIEVTIVDTTTTSPGITAASIRVYVDGVLAYNGSTFQPGFDGASSLVTAVGANTYRIYVDVTTPFASQVIVPVRVVAASVGGGATIDSTYIFTTVDVIAPRVVSVQAVGHRTVRVTFDEDITETEATFVASALHVQNYTITPTTIPAMPVVVVGATSVTSRTVELTLDTEMTQNAEYLLVIDDAEDLHGNPIVAPFNSGAFTGYACAAPVDRDFNLFTMLPLKNRRDDLAGTGDLLKFITCLQEVTDLLLCDVDAFANILDPDLADEQFVDAMLADLGNPFAFDLSLTDKRRLIYILVPLYRQKGTEIGIKNVVRFFLGLEVAVVPFTSDTMSLGESELGFDWILGPAGSYALYAFDVEVTTALTVEQRIRLRALVDYMKPAHTHFVNLIEPIIPVVIDHLELGLSHLGDTWVLH